MKYIFLCLITCTFFKVGYCQNNDASDINKVFEEYKTAILNDNPQAALNAIDSRTVNYYISILNGVKYADSAKISKMSLIDMITILGIRSIASREEIIDMKDVDAFIFSIKKGLVGKNSVINNRLGKITIDKNFAKGELLVDGNKTGVYFNFYREENKWKFNLTEIFSLGNMSMKHMIEESEMSQNEFLLDVLSKMSGKSLTYDIWKPVL